MKPIFFLILLAISTSPLLAQEKPENKSAQSLKQVESDQKDARTKFIDADGDGIDDRVRKDEQSGESSAGQGRQLRQQRRDRFVDQDGDGIADDRCSGTGLRQGRRHGAAKGGGQ